MQSEDILDSPLNDSFDDKINKIDKWRCSLVYCLKKSQKLLEKQEKEIEKFQCSVSKEKEIIEKRRQKINAFLRGYKILEDCIKTMEAAINRLKVQKYSDPRYRYTKQKSNAKYLFDVPTHGYLQHLTNNEFKGYERFQIMLTKYPQIHKPSETSNMETWEEVIDGDYY